ncbi:MAG: DUF421 domain-containing protein [Chloroflexota bacterium]
MQEIDAFITRLLGLDVEELTIWHMVIRAIVVYLSALLMVRIGEKRFFGKNTAFDIILGIIFGSVVSRAITGSSEFFPTLVAGLTLILLHWLFATLSFNFDWFGSFIKGNSRLLVKDGEILWEAMRKSHISEKDLMSALRLQGNIEKLDEVKEARLERSGNISVIKSGSS